MAGYIFQLDRALYWLAISQSGAKVGIEAFVDDIAVINEGKVELIILEQDKFSISPNSYPLGNKSKNLWNTLNIWLKAIDEGEVDLSKTEFHLVTNKNLSPNSILKRLVDSKDKNEIEVYIKELRDLGRDAPVSLAMLIQSVLAYDNKILKDLINRIYISDGSSLNHSQQLEKIASRLQIPSNIPTDEVIQSLLGWLQDTTMTLWEKQQPGWITKEAFNNQMFRITQRLHDRVFRETAKDLLPVSYEDRKAHKGRIFVMQLLQIAIGENNEELIGAIDDYIRCSTEITRLSKEGNITARDIKEFKGHLVDRWKKIFASHNRQLQRMQRPVSDYKKIAEDIGYEIYDESTNHREPLAGQQTEEYYLTAGYYHRLADALEVGWHPDFGDLFKPTKESIIP